MTIDGWNWPHIRRTEIACRHCGELKVHTATLDAFERFRLLRGGAPIAIMSGYRCPVHNKAVGGAPSSYHMLGQALDLSIYPVGQLEFASTVALAAHAGFTGMGFYPQKRFIHLDTGPVRFWWGDE